MKIPSEHQGLMPYLVLADSAAFIEFAKAVFNSEPRSRHYRDDNKSLMHAEINIQGTLIMFCDATPKFEACPANFFVYVEDADASIAKARQSGGIVLMEAADQSYGRSGGIKDPAGNTWWITSVKE